MFRVLSIVPFALALTLTGNSTTAGNDTSNSLMKVQSVSPYGRMSLYIESTQKQQEATLRSLLRKRDAADRTLRKTAILIGAPSDVRSPEASQGLAKPSDSKPSARVDLKTPPTKSLAAQSLPAEVEKTPAPRGELRFGIAAPFTGPSKELGREMKLGIETAFAVANDEGGIDGKSLKLFSVDDGYEPSRTGEAMKNLVERDHVIGILGNVGTPTAAVALPYALQHRLIFFGALSGANLLRQVPPDHYVFNFRPSYAEETEATVKYLVTVRGIRPQDIAVFAQHDSFGEAGYAGVTKALRGLGRGPAHPLLLSYERNTIDVDDAVAKLRAKRPTIKAVIMVAAYRAAAKFIEKTRNLYPAMVYTNVSFVGSTALAEELSLLGPKYLDGVIVTQVVPNVEGYSKIVIDYRNALAKYFPGEEPNYISFEGYIDAKILIKGLKRASHSVDTEKLIAALEQMHDLDLGLGTAINFGQSEHQGSHKIWGTELDRKGKFNTLDLQ